MYVHIYVDYANNLQNFLLLTVCAQFRDTIRLVLLHTSKDLALNF